MTLCWSLDKLGPMTRSVEDAMLVLQAITGPDAGDVASVPSQLDFDATAQREGIASRLLPAVDEGELRRPKSIVRRWRRCSKLGMVPVEVTIPDWPYNSLKLILFAEGAAAFEELTLSGGLRELKVQVPDAWPNLFRQARFLSAVDFVQADRLRRKVALEMARVFSQVDLLLVPSLRDEMLVITQLHRASVAHVASGICRGHEGAQRLGTRSEASAAEVFAAAARAARSDADRAVVR